MCFRLSVYSHLDLGSLLIFCFDWMDNTNFTLTNKSSLRAFCQTLSFIAGLPVLWHVKAPEGISTTIISIRSPPFSLLCSHTLSVGSLHPPRSAPLPPVPVDSDGSAPAADDVAAEGWAPAAEALQHCLLFAHLDRPALRRMIQALSGAVPWQALQYICF